MGAKSTRELGRVPLADELLATGPLRTKSKKRKAKREDEVDGFVDSKPSRKILKIGQELEEEDREQQRLEAPSSAFTFESRFPEEDEPQGAEAEDEDEWEDDGEEIIDEAVSDFLSCPQTLKLMMVRKWIQLIWRYSTNSCLLTTKPFHC